MSFPFYSILGSLALQTLSSASRSVFPRFECPWVLPIEMRTTRPDGCGPAPSGDTEHPAAAQQTDANSAIHLFRLTWCASSASVDRTVKSHRANDCDAEPSQEIVNYYKDIRCAVTQCHEPNNAVTRQRD